MKKILLIFILMISLSVFGQYNVNNQIMQQQQNMRMVQMMNDQQRIMREQWQFTQRMLENSRRIYVSKQTLLQMNQANTMKFEGQKKEVENWIADKQNELKSLQESDLKNKEKIQKEIEKGQNKISRLDKKILKNKNQEFYLQKQVADEKEKLDKAQRAAEEAKAKKEAKKKDKKKS